MWIRRLTAWFGLLALCGVLRADDLAGRVVLLANREEPESIRLAEHYARKRGVPEANIIALRMPLAEQISRRTFVDEIFNPLQEELVKRGWIDAIGMSLKDGLGRRRYSINGHTIAYLVICRGVPLKVAHEAQVPGEESPANLKNEFRTNAAAVDSELALLAATNAPVTAFLPNPLFEKERPSTLEAAAMVKVSRLDGATFGDARRLVDDALEAERTGLIGRAYVDLGGPHSRGDDWLEEAAKLIGELKFDADVDRAPATLGPGSRMDAPALYFGWYAGNLDGPFAREGMRFAPGAVAMHIHSFSAATLRTTNQGWTAPLVARGVVATVGNVNEPYLEFTHRPQHVLYILAKGGTWGDAAAFAVPVLSWQAIAIGDPLYRPFKVSLEDQWARRAQLPSERRAFVVLRRIRELERAGRRNDAIWAGQEALKGGGEPAIAWAVAELQRAEGDADGERKTLKDAAERRRFAGQDAALGALLAQRLMDAGEAGDALRVWRTVLSERDVEPTVRRAWLPKARDAARAAKDARQTLRWEEEIAAANGAGAANAR